MSYQTADLASGTRAVPLGEKYGYPRKVSCVKLVGKRVIVPEKCDAGSMVGSLE